MFHHKLTGPTNPRRSTAVCIRNPPIYKWWGSITEPNTTRMTPISPRRSPDPQSPSGETPLHEHCPTQLCSPRRPLAITHKRTPSWWSVHTSLRNTQCFFTKKQTFDKEWQNILTDEKLFTCKQLLAPKTPLVVKRVRVEQQFCFFMIELFWPWSPGENAAFSSIADKVVRLGPT